MSRRRALKRSEPGRRCSFCDGLIAVGEGLRYMAVDGLAVWVHEGCADDGRIGEFDHEHMRRWGAPRPETLA